MLSAFARGGASKAGWTGISAALAHPGGQRASDLWLIGMLLLAISLLASAANLIATIRSLRADGMTWSNLPMFAWAVIRLGVG